MIGSPAGFKNKCIVVIPTKIGKIKASAKGTKNPDNSKTPTRISITLTIGKKYPVLAKAPISAPASGAIGGLAMKLKNPFNPKITKANPNSSLAPSNAFVFI